MNVRVHSYIPPDDPCPICVFPPSQYSQIVGLRNPCDPAPEQAAVPSFSTSISLVSSLLSQETVKLILGQKRYQESGKWPDESGEPLRVILFIDVKNNRYTKMEMKKNEKCYVCGSEGIAKDIVRRYELPLSNVRHSRKKMEQVIRTALNCEGGTLRVFSETSRGEESVDNSEKKTKRFQKGDYLRVLCERGNGEFTESIAKLS